jgi:hypothetical protein
LACDAKLDFQEEALIHAFMKGDTSKPKRGGYQGRRPISVSIRRNLACRSRGTPCT